MNHDDVPDASPTSPPAPRAPIAPPIPAGISATTYPPAVPYWAPPLEISPPRVWTAIVVPIMAMFAAAIAASFVMLAFAIPEIGIQGVSDQETLMAWVVSAGKTPGGMLTLVLPGQLAFLGAALLAAKLSPVPMHRRLGITRPVVPWWAILLILPGTLFSGVIGDLLVTAVIGHDRGEHLKMMYDLFRGPTGAFLALVTFLISAVPGFGEEALFRGYAQTRLLQRWHPAAAIATSGVLFAVAHMDPAQSLGVLPLGIWFGVVAWLCRSIWPAVICHTINNAAAVLITNTGAGDPTEHVKFDASGIVLMSVTGAFAAAAVWVMWNYRKKSELNQAPL